MTVELKCVEGADSTYTTQILDSAGTGIPQASLTTIVLTLLDEDGAAINGRDEQDVNDANNVAIDSSGNLVWSIQPEDNVIVGNVREGRHERHRALFKWTYDGGAQTGQDTFSIAVRKLPTPP